MKVITYLIIFITVTFLLLGSQLATEGEDLQNITKNLYWNSSKYETSVVNVSINTTAINGERVKNIVTKTLDWMGYSMFEYGKIVLEWGYNHPQYNYRFIWNILRYGVYWLIFTMTFPILVPLLALIYLIIQGLIELAKKASEIIKLNTREKD